MAVGGISPRGNNTQPAKENPRVAQQVKETKEALTDNRVKIGKKGKSAEVVIGPDGSTNLTLNA